MNKRPVKSTRTYTLCPCTTLFRSSPSPDAPTSDIGEGRTTSAPRPHFHLPLGPSPLGVFQHDQAVAIRQLPAPFVGAGVARGARADGRARSRARQIGRAHV